MEKQIWVSKTLTCRRSTLVLIRKNEVYDTTKTYFSTYFMNSKMALLIM